MRSTVACHSRPLCRSAELDARRRTSGRGHWQQVMGRRDSTGLWLPYGRRAHALGLALDDTVPAQRTGPQRRAGPPTSNKGASRVAGDSPRAGAPFWGDADAFTPRT